MDFSSNVVMFVQVIFTFGGHFAIFGFIAIYGVIQASTSSLRKKGILSFFAMVFLLSIPLLEAAVPIFCFIYLLPKFHLGFFVGILVFFFYFSLIIVLMLNKNNFWGRKKIKGEIFNRDIPTLPPHIIAALDNYYRINKKTSGNVLSSTILNLEIKGYIEINKQENEYFLIRKKPKIETPLLEFETAILDLVFNRGSEEDLVIDIGEVAINKLKQYLKTNEGIAKLQGALIIADDDFYKYVGFTKQEEVKFLTKRRTRSNLVLTGTQKSSMRMLGFFLVVFPVVAGIGCVFLSAATASLQNPMTVVNFSTGWFGAPFASIGTWFFINSKIVRQNLLNEECEKEVSKIDGLIRFYKSMTLAKERETLEVAIWKEHLVYATALGVSKKVTKQSGAGLDNFDVIINNISVV
jgi:hypothetical protein